MTFHILTFDDVYGRQAKDGRGHRRGGACVVYDNDIPYPEGSYRVRRTCKGWEAYVI